jgi:hypothetical protein
MDEKPIYAIFNLKVGVDSVFWPILHFVILRA